MAHVREQITQTVASLLDGGTNWTHVFEQRIAPRHRAYPYLLVFADSENSSVETLESPFQLDRELNLVIQGHYKFTEDETVEIKLNAIASEIETTLTKSALNAALILATYRPVVSVYLAGTDYDLAEISDSQTDAVVTLGFVVTYQTVEGLPDA